VLLTGLLLATTAALPPVIPDPRSGPSPWELVSPGAAIPSTGADGYLVPVPPKVDDAWLEKVVALGGRHVPLVALMPQGESSPVLPYFDAVAVDRLPAEDLASLSAHLGGLPVVVSARDSASAVRALAEGAGAVLMPGPLPVWARELHGLLPEPTPAHLGTERLATALRSTDLATVVAVPAGFPGGDVVLPGDWYASASLVSRGETVPLVVRRDESGAAVSVPAAATDAVVVAYRPSDALERMGMVSVSGQRLPSAAEILARYQRAAASQDRLLHRWTGRQRLELRVWVAELARSFDVVLQGPAFFDRTVGTDWEISRAWVDGVSWNPDDLPELPLLEPRRPPVPPLAVRLEPTYDYVLRGVATRHGRRCYALAFERAKARGEAARRGVAWIDAATFGLAELDESAEGLTGDVRSTRTVTVLSPHDLGGQTIWLPESVVADDLLAAFGGTATVHRKLELSDLALNPADFLAARDRAYGGPHRMLRDRPSGIVPLVPDGRGGRVVDLGRHERQHFLLAGVAVDPGLDIPIPFGGLQIQDFRFRGRDEQLRAFLAAVVNDVAWVKRYGRDEVSLRGFVQLLPLTSQYVVDGRERKDEEIKLQRQRLGAGAGTTVGAVRLLLDVGIDRLDFGSTDNTAGAFVVPRDTWEWNARIEANASVRGATLAVSAEQGWRQHWAAWGLDGREQPRPRFQRYRASAVYEKSPFARAKLHLDAEVLVGRDLDRFSAFAPSRFAGPQLRGIASNRFLADRMAVIRAAFAVPVASRVRAEIGADFAWVHDPFSGYRARPVNGVGVSLSMPGPWRTLVQTDVGAPMATPGGRSLTLMLMVLRPL
jgi:hypothetical protein